MMDFVRRQPVVVALGAIVALLLIVIAVEAQLGARMRAQGAPGGGKVAAAEPKLLPPVAVGAPEQAYPQMTARPLFTPTRRPAPPVETAPQQAFQPGQFVLLGVTIAGNTRIALLREKANGRIHRVEKGGDVNGIKVAEIEPEKVKLTQSGSSEDVQLTVQKAMPGATAAQLGPFGAGAPVPGFPLGAQGGTAGAGAGQPMAGMPPNPASPPNPVAAAGQFGPLPGGNLTAPPSLLQQPPQAATPMTPEELLARRRARRSSQTQ